MYYLKRLSWLALAGVCVLVMGYGAVRFAIEAGVSPLRYVVQDVAIFAAGLLGLLACRRQILRLAAGREAALEPTRRFKGHSLEAQTRHLAQYLALAIVGLLAAFCIIAIFRGERDVVFVVCGVLLAVLFVLMVPLVKSQHRAGAPTLRLDARGLDHVWYGAVPWSAVHGVFHLQTKIKHTTQHALLLGVSQPARYLDRMPWIARLMTGKLGQPRGRYGILRIALNPLDQDPFLVADAADVLRARVSPPPVAGWFPGMDEESIDVLLESAYLTSDDHGLSPEQVLARMQALAPRMKKVTDRLMGIH